MRTREGALNHWNSMRGEGKKPELISQGGSPKRDGEVNKQGRKHRAKYYKNVILK